MTPSRLDALERRLSAQPVIAWALLLLVGVLALLWPAAINGQPFMLHDTTAYIRGAAYPPEKLLGLKTVWSVEAAAAAPSPVAGAAPAPAKSLSSVEDKTVFSGRSVYYGSLLFWGFVAGGLWLPALLQAVVATGAVYLALRRLVPRPIVSTMGTLTILGLASPLSWFSGYLMPDVFAGLGLLAAALLITHVERMPRAEIGVWFGLLAFALAAHTSHLATAAVLLGLALVARLVLQRDWRAGGLAAVAAALAVALLAEAVFSVAVTRVTGASPVRVPTLTARVMHSPSGTGYLQAACPSVGYAVCAYLDRAPMIANDFLWHPDPNVGVFTHAAPEVRRKLAEEQSRVLLGAFLHEPVGMTVEFLQRWAMLASVTGIAEFNHGAEERAYFAGKLPPSLRASFAATPSAQGTLPIAAFQALFALTTFGGVALVLWLLRSEVDRMADLALLIAAGILTNAAICAALSGVEPRYQARIVWLLPFLATALGWRRYQCAAQSPAEAQLVIAAA